MNDWEQMLDADILTLGMAADEARRRGAAGSRVTYLRVHTVMPGDLLGGLAVPDAAAEVRLYETPATLDDAIAQVAALRGAAVPRRVVAFSMSAIEERGWRAPELSRLVAAGWSDVAELPVDRLADVEASMATLAAAGIVPQRITTSHPVDDRRREILKRVAGVFAKARRPLKYAPLPRIAPADKPTTGYDDVRMVALARLTPDIGSIEIDWSLYGPKLAQVALIFGADHLDAVSAATDSTLGPRRGTVEDVERNIRAAGFEPVEIHAGA